MVLWVLVWLLLVMREGVDPHEAVIATPLRVSHGRGGEVGGRQHDWGRHALLPHLAGAALLWKVTEVLDKLATYADLLYLFCEANFFPRIQNMNVEFQNKL